MARSKLTFGTIGERKHAQAVEGDPEQVIGALKNRWARLNRALGREPSKWVWVNARQVLYVEPVAAPT